MAFWALLFLTAWEAIGPYGGDKHFTFVAPSSYTAFAGMGFSGGFWRSTDGGENWVHVTTGDPFLDNYGVNAMTEVIAEAETLLFAAGPRGLWLSRDDGTSWERIETGDPLIDSIEANMPTSIDAWGDTVIFLGMRYLAGGVPFNGWIMVRNEGGSWHAERYELLGASDVFFTRLDFAQDWPEGPTLFVSCYNAGLFAYRWAGGSWSVDTIPLPTTSPLTGVTVDAPRGIIYVMTFDDAFYRGRWTGGLWSWDHIDPAPSLTGENKPAAYCLFPDPFDPDRLWYGMVDARASLLPTPAHANRVGVFYWDTTTGAIVHLHEQTFWGVSVAVSPDPSRAVPTPYGTGTGAGLALVPSYSYQCVLRTDDGGLSWRTSYWGINGEMQNRTNLIHLPDGTPALVALAISFNGISFDYGATWDTTRWFYVYTDSFHTTGYNWEALGIPSCWPPYVRSTPFGTYYDDFLVAAGVPSVGKIGGLFRGATDALPNINRSRLPELDPGFSLCFTQLTSEPVFRAMINPYDSAFVLLAEQVGGIGIYNGFADVYHRFARGLPNPAGTWSDSLTWGGGGVRAIEVSAVDGDTLYFASTMEGNWLATEFDMPFAFPSRIFRARNLRFTPDSIAYDEPFVQIYPPTPGDREDSAIVSLSSPRDGTGRLIAATATGKILYTSNAQEFPVDWKTLYIASAEPSPVTSEPPRVVWDMAVDWELGVFFLSVFHYGVLVGSLEEVESLPSGATITLYPQNEGLYCIEARMLCYDPESGYLFVGTDARSTFRSHVEPTGVFEENRAEEAQPTFSAAIVSDGEIIISLSKPLRRSAKLRILDITGRTVGSYTVRKGAKSVRVTLSGANGIYFLKLLGRCVKLIKL